MQMTTPCYYFLKVSSTGSELPFLTYRTQERTNELSHIAVMNRVAPDGVKWGVSKIFSLLLEQGKLSYEQRLRLKDDGRPCPSVTIKHHTSVGVYASEATALLQFENK